MPTSIEDFKGQVSKGRGFAKANLFRVILPQLKNSDTKELNLICKSVSIPGRQIISQDHQMGTPLRKIANGYAVTDIQLSFWVLNTYNVKEYFQTWQDLAHHSNYETGYYFDYTKNVKIQNLQSANAFSLFKKQLGYADKLPSFLLNRLPNDLLGGILDLSQGEININIGEREEIIHEVELLECYPTTMNEITLSNDLDGIVELSVQLSFRDWIATGFEPHDDLRDSILGGIIQEIKNGLFK